ncbi:MAG: hypothetical protein AAFW98_03215, partial [Pseudomonadota bacterium]
SSQVAASWRIARSPAKSPADQPVASLSIDVLTEADFATLRAYANAQKLNQPRPPQRGTA